MPGPALTVPGGVVSAFEGFVLMLGSTRARLKRASAIAVLAAATLSLAACASTSPKEASGRKRSKEYFAESIFGVKASPRVTNLRRNLPRGGGRDQTGKPYVVRGKWYYPKEDKNYRKLGGASWYGDAFHGRLTANGEIYDMTHLTAAHPTMPLPSYARVTNMANGSSVIVRVNDRGPYSDGRIIDLSHRAAELLDYSHAGVARVKVEYVGRAPLDGRDDRYLVASYRPGNGPPDPSDGLPAGVMIAMNGPQPTAKPRGVPIPFPQETSPAFSPVATASFGGIDLPATGPIAPQRPQVERDTQVAFAAMSYAARQEGEASKALSAITGASTVAPMNRPASSYVAAGTFADRADADALAAMLGPLGDVKVRKDGKRAFSVTLRGDGRLDGDALLEGAWAAGAADAITVRE